MKRSGVRDAAPRSGVLFCEKALRRRARVTPGGRRSAVRDGQERDRRPEAGAPFFPPLPPGEHFDYAALISPEGLVLASDPELPGRLGTTPEAFIGADIYSFFEPGVAEERKQAAQAVLSSGAPLRYKEASRPGRVYDMRILPIRGREGAVHALAVLVNDVTAENRAEERRRKLAAAIEQAVEAVVITDNEFTIEYVNQSFQAMTGYSRKEAAGRSVGGFFKGRLQEEKFRRCAALLQKGEVCSDRFLLVAKSGEVCVCDQSASPVRVKYGVVLGHVFIWRDATQVAKLEKQLRHAQKVEAVGALAGGIAHDFNNILGPIILHAELCLSKIPQDHPLRGSLPEILDAARRARRLAEQLLYLGRGREKDEPIPFNLGALVKECVKLLRSALAPGINVRVGIEPGSDLTLADPDQIHQVIMNLATNAAHAMREFGGDLTFSIAAESVDEADCGESHGLPIGRYVRLSVRDSGHGMSPALLERIFEPFFTTKGGAGGAGLGLSVVRNIVNRMGGAIEVESEPGMGTSFHVFLPGAPAAGPDSPAPAKRPARPVKPLRILFVDDDEDSAGGVAMALKGMGYAVECRVTASEALTAFLRGPERYDLAMLDLVMPHMSGLELAEEMLRVRTGLPVILFSAYAGKVSQTELERCGIRAFLPKPFDLADLEEAIRRARDPGNG